MVEITLFFIVVAFTLGVSAGLALIVTAQSERFLLVLGPFFGAFFAFIFVRLGEGLKRLYDRRIKHHDALVHLEHYLNDASIRVDENRYMAEGFIEVVGRSVSQPGVVAVSGNRLSSIPLDYALLLNLTNLDLINDLFGLFVDLRKLNDSAEALMRQYDQALKSLGRPHQDVEEYRSNAERALHGMRALHHGFQETRSDLLLALAKVRVLARDLPFFAWLMQRFSQTRYRPDFTQHVQRELATLKAEMARSEEESTRRIRAMEEAIGAPPE